MAAKKTKKTEERPGIFELLAADEKRKEAERLEKEAELQKLIDEDKARNAGVLPPGSIRPMLTPHEVMVRDYPRVTLREPVDIQLAILEELIRLRLLRWS